MVYRMENGKISPMAGDTPTLITEGYNIGVFGLKDAQQAAELFGVLPDTVAHTLTMRSARFESHEGMDIICAGLLNHRALVSPLERVYIFLQKGSLLFISGDPQYVEKLLERVINDGVPDVSFGKLLFMFFEYLTEKDSEYLEDIEQGIINLEDDVILEKLDKNYVKTIISLRKRLMILKRYYEQLLGVFSYLGGNENGLIDKRALHNFKILEARVDRLYHSVLNLRDYVTQIREAYQSQVDISLNVTMKVFTVITAIFLPLTLIAGWYGMNLQMPEFNFPYSYPIVIAVSILVVVVCVIYFKKHKWF